MWASPLWMNFLSHTYTQGGFLIRFLQRKNLWKNFEKNLQKFFRIRKSTPLIPHNEKQPFLCCQVQKNCDTLWYGTHTHTQHNTSTHCKQTADFCRNVAQVSWLCMLKQDTHDLITPAKPRLGHALPNLKTTRSWFAIDKLIPKVASWFYSQVSVS